MKPCIKNCLGLGLSIASRMIIPALLLIQGIKTANAAVTLSYFIAIPGDNVITLEWETATEFNNAGFYVTRSFTQEGPFERISDFIPAEGLGIEGAQYQYSDTNVTNGTTYYYILEAIDTSQFIEYYGPISATAGIPTPTNTSQPSQTPTQTYTPIPPSITATITPSSTNPPSSTPTPETNNQTAQPSPTPTNTQTKPPTKTPTVALTHTNTVNPTKTKTRAAQSKITDTPIPTSSRNSPTITATQTRTPTKTIIPLPLELLLNTTSSPTIVPVTGMDLKTPESISISQGTNQTISIWAIVLIVIGFWIIVTSLFYIRYIQNKD